MYKQSELKYDGAIDPENVPPNGDGAATASLSLANAITTPLRNLAEIGYIERAKNFFARTDFVPDLGQDIGSARWFRGLATLSILSAAAFSGLPSFEPLYGAQAAALPAKHFDEARAQMIMPLALGGDTGRRMAATDAVQALKESPERPFIQLTATLGRGDSFSRVLRRAGVGGKDARQVSDLVASAVKLSAIDSGTKFDVTLGRRDTKNSARPLDKMAFRARFDLGLEVNRVDGALALTKNVIKVDNTPLRIKGLVGNSLYRSARAAGAPPKSIQKYLKVISKKMSLNRGVRGTDEFDIIIDHKRAETGEVEVGNLLYAAINRDGKPKAQLLSWKTGGNTRWYAASGVGESSGRLARPVSGRVTSRYGMRRHPILRYRRMHSGLDFKARRGTPIHSAADGVVSYSGRNGGYGKYVKIKHSGGLASGYAHMSRIKVRSGARVRKGQVIGYVGSTGLSSGPHLHYELYRRGKKINPSSVKFSSRNKLSGRDLANFKAKLNRLTKVEPGEALVKTNTAKVDVRANEMDRLKKPVRG